MNKYDLDSLRENTLINETQMQILINYVVSQIGSKEFDNQFYKIYKEKENRLYENERKYNIQTEIEKE